MPSYRVPNPADYGEGEDYLFCTLCFDLWSPYHVCWQVQRRWAITLAHECYIASEDVLARDWDTPEEDEAWKDL